MTIFVRIAAMMSFVVLPALIVTIRPSPTLAMQGAPGTPVTIPCNPTGPTPGLVTVGPNGTTSSNPTVEVLEDQVVTDPIDMNAEFPTLLNGNDGGLQEHACTTSFDIGISLPPMNIPSGSSPPVPPMPSVSTQPVHLPAIPFTAPHDCPWDAASPAPPTCGGPLNCSLPFCGRDIIFIDGLATDELMDLIKARHGKGLPGTLAALQRWPQNATAFTNPAGYFRMKAEADWSDFLKRKLAPAYQAANAANGPRFLVAPWASTQRMEFGIHAVLSQIAEAIQHGTNVEKLDLNATGTPVVSAKLTGSGFCGRGCVVVSYSTGGPISISAMNIAANGSRAWITNGLRVLPRFIKGHVAFHPALDGSEIAWHVLAAANAVTGGCSVAANLLMALSSNPLPSGIDGCVAANDLNQSVLVDLSPPVMSALWRPVMSASPAAVDVTVPTVVVAGAHPTNLAAFHWMAPVLPGYDDGVVSIDSQLGRPWSLLGMPRSLTFGPLPFPYYDRGSPTAKAIPYFLDQNHEAARRPLAHAAAPNLFLSPNGMILPSVARNEIPQPSTALPNVFSFLQSTAGHTFLLNVGSSPDSQSTDPHDGCAAGSYNYQLTGNYFGAQTDVSEESRAVFDSSVYTPRGRYNFGYWEVGLGGPIPLLSPNLKGAIEGEAKGRYIRIRIKLPLIKIDKIFWIWKREYMRMSGWRCRDEIDYALDFAFRR
jgi:hypothetical protein